MPRQMGPNPRRMGPITSKGVPNKNEAHTDELPSCENERSPTKGDAWVRGGRARIACHALLGAGANWARMWEQAELAPVSTGQSA